MNQLAPPEPELLTELDLGSARGGRKPSAPLDMEVVRPLVPEDLAAIANPPAIAGALPTVKALRHSHHRLAQLIAEGKPQVEVCRVTGYSASYLSILKTDPAFEELIQYYAEQRQLATVDSMERLRLLGIDATEKLHEQLHDETQTWSKRELMELVDMAVVKPQAAQVKTQGPGPGPGISLEVKFVGTPGQPEARVIDAPFTEVVLPPDEARK